MAEAPSVTPQAVAISDDWQRLSDDEFSVLSLPSDDEESPVPDPCPCPRSSRAHSTSSTQDGTMRHAEDDPSELGPDPVKEASRDQDETALKKEKRHKSVLGSPRNLWNQIQQQVQAISPSSTPGECGGGESYSSIDRLLEDFALEGEARRILPRSDSSKETVSDSGKTHAQPLSQGKAEQQRALPTTSEEPKKQTSPPGQTTPIHTPDSYPTAASTGPKTLHSALAKPLAHPISIHGSRQACPATTETGASPVLRYGNPLQYYGPTHFLLQQSGHRPFSTETTPDSGGSGTVRPPEVLNSASDKIQDSLKKLKLLSQPLNNTAPVWRSRVVRVPHPTQTTARAEKKETGSQDVESGCPGTGADPVSLRDKLQSVKHALSKTLMVIDKFGRRELHHASEMFRACTFLQVKVDELLPVLWWYAHHFRSSPATFSPRDFPFHPSFSSWMSDILTCLEEIRSEIQNPNSTSLDRAQAGGFHARLRELTHLIHSFRAEMEKKMLIIESTLQAYRAKRKSLVPPAAPSASSPSSDSGTKEAVNSPDAKVSLLNLTSQLWRVVSFFRDCQPWLCSSTFELVFKAIATMKELSDELVSDVLAWNISDFVIGWNSDGHSMESLIGGLEEYRKIALLADAGKFQAESKPEGRDEGNKISLDEKRLACLELEVAGFLKSTRKIRGEITEKNRADETESERQ